MLKKQDRFNVRARFSLWVILGFMFWVGFLIGALIMHASVK